MESEKSDKNVKLWIGNLDTKLDEFQLLKILEQFGKISSFDFLYHLNDRGSRTPRGYAFVTYELVTSAMEAINVLHKKKILTKVIFLIINNIFIQGGSKEAWFSNMAFLLYIIPYKIDYHQTQWTWVNLNSNWTDPCASLCQCGKYRPEPILGFNFDGTAGLFTVLGLS